MRTLQLGLGQKEKRVFIGFEIKLRRIRIRLERPLEERAAPGLQIQLTELLTYIQQYELQEGTQLMIDIIDYEMGMDLTKTITYEEAKAKNKVDWVREQTYFILEALNYLHCLHKWKEIKDEEKR